MKTILIIDDNKDDRENLLEILALEMYASMEAENGQIGLGLMRQHSPDLIICDVDMPGMSGLDVLRTAKADPINAGIPFVVRTGHTDEVTRKTAYNLGAEAFLTKPTDIAEFLSTIGRFLGDTNPALST
jgi:CheY-like chemotaxis protein